MMRNKSKIVNTCIVLSVRKSVLFFASNEDPNISAHTNLY